LEYLPNFYKTKSFEFISEDWALIKIDYTAELDVLKDCPADKISAIGQSANKQIITYLESLRKYKNTWSIVTIPNPKWAAKIFNQQESNELTEKLWQVLIKICMLDKADPIAAWQKFGTELQNRAKKLTELNLDKLIFTGPETNLEIGLNKNCRWTGGPKTLDDGRTIFVNIPTAEIFTTPDYRRTKGKVKIYKPVKVLESIVENASFEFKDGKVVAFEADKGQDIIDKYLKIDDGAKMLGEIALVAVDSPIAATNLIFNNILLDENAASHLALGSGIPNLLENAASLSSDKDLKKAGCNISLVHTDFMLGSEEVDVLGITCAKKEIPIMEKGIFKI
jgi:aminopeptidase